MKERKTLFFYSDISRKSYIERIKDFLVNTKEE